MRKMIALVVSMAFSLGVPGLAAAQAPAAKPSEAPSEPAGHRPGCHSSAGGTLAALGAPSHIPRVRPAIGDALFLPDQSRPDVPVV